MKLKYFFIALVAMVACFSEAFAQQVITVSNAEELKQALKEAGAAPQARQAAQGGAPTYTGLKVTLDQYEDASLIDGYFDLKPALVLDLNGYVVNGDITIESGQLSIIDNKGTGAWIGCITVDTGAKLAVGSGNLIAGESGVAVINKGTLSTDGGAVIGKITNTGSMEGVATYNTALVANKTVAQAALNAAIDGQTVQFASDIEGDLTVVQKPNTKITIDGAIDDASKTLKGAITIDGKSARYEAAGVTIKNLNLDATAITTDASINLGVKGNNNTRYTNNVTIENCTFTDNDYSAAAVKSYTGGDKNLVIKGCTATGMHSLAQLANVEEGLVIEGCIANTKNGINLGSSAGVQITKNTINVKGYGVRIGASSGGESGTITMTENTLQSDNADGDAVVVLRGTAPAQADLSMTENVVLADTHISGTTASTKISAEANYWSGKENPVVAEGSTPVVVNSYYTDAARTTLERNEMGSIYAYVMADRIFGDVTTNAEKTLVINIFGKNGSQIGTCTAEKAENLTAKPKTLTWRMNFGADDSDSWKMEWANGAPSIDNMPAKVQVVVDGVALGEAEVKLTQNGDGQNPVFAAKTKDGKISSFIVSEGFGFSKAAATLVSAAAEGDNIVILEEGTYTVPTGKNNLTITGKADGVVKFDMSKAVGVHSSMTFNDVTFEYSTNQNYIGLQHAGTMVYNNCTINGQVFLYGASETFNNCTFKQDSRDAYNVWTYGAKEVVFNKCTFNSAGKSVLIYAEQAGTFNTVTVKECTFNASEKVEGKAAIEMDSSLTGGINLTIDDKTTATGFGTGNVSGNSLWNNKKGNGNNANNDITVKVGEETVLAPTYEAKIGETGHRTYQEALAAVQAGETITLLADVTTSEVTTINKNIIFDGNGKTLTYTGTNRAFDVPNNETADIDVTIKNLTVVATTANRGLNYNENGKFNVEGVTVTIGENVDGYAINFPGMADGAQVTIKDSKLTSRNPLNIWGENMTINVHNSEIISVDNSTTYDYAAIQLNNDNYGNVANGTTVNVYGGSITALNDKNEPSNVVANATETGVVNISDETIVTGKVLNYVANIGGVYFGSLQAAVNAIEKHGYNSPIVIMKDFATSEATTIKSGLKVTINLNGKTITGTDNGTASFGLININPGAELTINGKGAITLAATNNRGWNAYSSVISNQRGKLTVNGGTIEHLGGTDMAYAIDNLTNGKGTYAETIINGGTVKSTYRAIRQFLNGTEAQNILTVNAGTIEGANKSIWMQDANKNANSGSLTVADNAVLKGDVYLFVTAGSTEWPVEVSIADEAFEDGSTVITGNIPAQHIVENANGVWGKSNSVASVNGVGYATLAEALAAAKNDETVTLNWSEGDAAIAMNGSVFGKNVTIKGTAKVDWSKGWLFVGRGGEGDATVTFDGANLTSASNSASFGIHVSGREKETNNKYDGTVVIKNSTIELDYLINRNAIELDKATLTVKNGFGIAGRPAKETETGANATATISLANNSKVVVNNHNGMGLGQASTVLEGMGVMNIDETSTFETTQGFVVTANGTMNIAGTAIVAGTLTNNGAINLTSEDATLKAQDGLTVNSTVEGRDVIYADGVYSTKLGLKGKGTEAEPYLINNVNELVAFRNSVNAGETKYNAPGVWVVLCEDIDLAGTTWERGIGDGITATFDGNFDGKGKTIKNFNVQASADSDKYLCAALFGYTYGGVTIKNLTIENANVEFTSAVAGEKYHNVGVLVAFANNSKGGKLNIDNVTVKGDIKIDAPQTFGVGAIVGYSYSGMGSITNTKVCPNSGSIIKGERFVGGIIGYSYNNAIIDKCSVENLAISGSNGVAGVAGLALNGNKITNCSVTNTTVNAESNVAYIVGELGSGNGGDVLIENCNAPQPWVGGSYATSEPFVASIGNKYYTSIAKALEVVKNGETITLVNDVTENVTLTEKAGLYYTIDGADKAMKGNITVNSLSDTNDNRRITIKNINFVDDSDANVDFISSAETNHYPRLTVEGCTFTGSGNNGDVALRLKSSHSVVIKDCTGTGLHSFLQNTSGWNLTIENVKVTDSKSGLALGTVQGVTVKGSNIVVPGYGIRLDANTYNNNAVIESNTVKAFIPVVVRKANTESNIEFKGENTMTATNTDGIWCAIGTSEYEENGKLPTDATGKVRVVLTDTGLSEEGIYGNYYDELTIHVASQTATTAVTREIYVATMDDAVAEAKTFNAGTVIYKVYDAVELTTGGSHGILDLGQNVVIEGVDPAAKLTIVGEGVPDIKGVTFKNITLADEGTYLPTANEFMYQNYIDCTFENVKFVDGIRLSGTSVIKDSQVEANTTNEYAIWLDAGVFTMTGTTVVGGADAYGLIKSDLVSKITITGNTFQYLGEANKEALNTKGAVIIAENNTFIDCAAGILPADKTNYADDSKTTVLTDAAIAENNTVTVYYAAIGEQKYETLLAAIKAAQEGETITLIRNVTMDYNARDAYETQAKNVVIDGNRKTLTLNQKNSDWASFGLANDSKLVLKNMTIEKTGYGDTSGAWNKHAIIFSCPVEMNDVIVNNSIAVQAGATLNNVTINEANGYYGLWINGNGQAVTINGGAINANNGGRGIKIADEYIDNPAQITLSVDGTVFTTAKKAAVLVSSKAGANITASNVNIENVAEDKVNFVWVDEDWAQYFDQVEVTGATVSPEGGEGSFAAAIIVDGTVQSYFKTFAKALETVANGQTITLITDVAENVTIKQVVGKNITIDGNSKTYTGTITVEGDGAQNGNNTETLTFKNINFVAKAEAYAITSVKGSQPRNITVDNCTFTGAADGPSYGIRVRNGWNYTVKNTTVDGLSSFFNATEFLGGLTVENVKVTNTKSAFNAAYGLGTASFKDIDLNVSGSAIWIQNNNASAVTIENAVISAATPIEFVEVKNNTNSITFNGENQFTATNANGAWLNFADNASFNATLNVTVNGTSLDMKKTNGLVAYAANAERSIASNVSLQQVIESSVDGDVVVMLTNITLDDDDVITTEDNIKAFTYVQGKNITLDMNGKNIEASYAGGNYLMGVVLISEGAGLTVTGEGSVNLTGTGKNIAYMFFKRGTTGYLTIENGQFRMNDSADSMVYTNGDEIVTINGGTFILDAVASQTNGFPVIFSAQGNNEKKIVVNAGSFNYDINHQIRPFEVYIAPEKALKKENINGIDMWTIVPAQAYVTEMLGDWNNVAGSREHKVGYATVADALAATNELGKTVTLVWSEGDAPIAMNGSVFGKDVTIKGTAKVDWSKGWLFVGRGGEGNATVTFDGANLTSASNNATYGIHVSGREKNTTNKYDGTLVIKNSTIELDFLINRNAIELDNATFTVKNGFGIAGRPASETESGANATATISLANNSKVVVNNHNGMGLGQAASVLEGMGVMNIDETSTFETTQGFVVTANGTMNIAGQAIVAGTLTNNGVINLTTEEATLEAQEGLNIATTLPGYFVKYANGVYTVCGEIVLVDGEVTDFVNEKDMIVKTLTYTRTFQERMLGKWQTLYVPFEIPVSELNAMGYEVAYFNDFRETLDEYGQVVANGTVLEMIIIRHGVLKANFPYAIKPKTEESLEMSLVLNDVKLYSTTGERESVECSSAFKRFTFDGTYKKATKSEIVGNNDVPFYAMNVNGIMQAMGPDPKLGAFRVYMTITKKNGEPFIQTPGQAALAREIPLHVIGEEDENGATIIYDVVEDNLNNNGNDFIYDLQGRRVSEPKKGGIYIKNGKKILY